MATMLEKYRQIQDKNRQQENLVAIDIWQQQELIYRIGVLETCQMFCQVAPITLELSDLISHFQMLDGYIQALATERRQGPVLDKEAEKRRETAQGNLLRIINDYRNRFAQYAPGKAEQYKRDIGGVINTVLPAWLQFRNSYIEIKAKEANANE